MCYKNIAGRFFGLVTKHACDRQTDRRTDRITTPKTALASLHRAVTRVKGVLPSAHRTGLFWPQAKSLASPGLEGKIFASTSAWVQVNVRVSAVARMSRPRADASRPRPTLRPIFWLQIGTFVSRWRPIFGSRGQGQNFYLLYIPIPVNN